MWHLRSAMADDDGPSWTDNKRRPRPALLSSSSVEVSRASGLSAATGTFGKANRFDVDKVKGQGCSSPYGHLFYHRNQLYKSPLERGKMCSLGIGARPCPTIPGGPPPCVGPGSYKIVHSAKGRASALDGEEFCSVTMKSKLPSSLTAVSMPSPGPHARYEVRDEDLTKRFPQYAKHKPLLSHGARHDDGPDRGEPGPGHYLIHAFKSVATSASCPNLHGAGERCMEATGGTKRCLKSTFGGAPRFSKDKVPNSSPQGDRYYAHSQIWGGEAYLNGARSCSFGACGKTDMANPLRGPRNDVSPVTYYPESGYAFTGGLQPSLPGLTTRNTSPIAQFSKNPPSTRSAAQQSSSPPGGAFQEELGLGAGGVDWSGVVDDA